MMRKVMTMMVTGALMLALATAVAFAETISCTGGTCFGTNDADTLTGTKNFDNIQGRGGDDTIEGRGGNDFLAGDQAFEQTLHGNDSVYGGAGNDELEGNQDNDLLVGGFGDDKLNPLDGQQSGTKDTVKGGPGNDDVFANDGNKDVINCGTGTNDTVRYDVGLDRIRDCEITTPPTNDTTPPTISSVSPADGAPGVAPSTNVTVTFSEAMDEASVEAPGTFTLEQGSSPVAATVTYDPSTRVATLDPSSDLASNTTYTATVSTGAKDLAGNAIAQEETWSFTTESEPTGVTVSPDTLDLSTTDPLFCSPRQEFLTVTNNGPGNVTFADVSITGPDAAYFSDGAKSFILNNGPFTVLEGNFFEDQVTFRPGSTIPDRNRDYEAILTYKDGAGATIGDPVALTATTSCLVF